MINHAPLVARQAIPPAVAAGKLQDTVDEATFQAFSAFLYRASGFAITWDKRYLIETRLGTVAGILGFASLAALGQALTRGAGPDVDRTVVEAMTTNETLFFRDTKPFEALKTHVMPAVRARIGDRRPRILCAAASTGQEPYSVAMTICESIRPGDPAAEVVATDIDTSVLERAKSALYSQFEVQRGVPTPLLLKYFRQEAGTMWRLKDPVRTMVRFQQMNLLEDMSRLGSFDIIFCRNVLLYFDVATKSKVLARLSASLNPGGFLFLGCAETVIGLCAGLTAVSAARGLYQTMAKP